MDLFASQDNPRNLQGRLIYLTLGIVVIFLILLLRTGYLQVIQGQYYREQSKLNRIRVVHIQPSRGLIFDRRGELLANNVPSFNLYVVLEDVQDTGTLLDRLENLIQLDRTELEQRIRLRKNSVPYLPMKLKEGLSLREVVLVESHQLDLAGIQMEAEPQRNYLYGSLASHLMGYVGEISNAQLSKPENRGLPAGITVGQTGVELTYDAYIRGQAGEKRIEVDALGHEMKTLQITNPEPGDDIYLTIDQRLQAVAEKSLGENAGSIVAIDPRNGEVLAMVSYPPFDPNQLSRSLSRETWETLSLDPMHPLSNRAIQGQYPPGSTFKLIIAAAGLETKLVRPEDEITCLGNFRFGRRNYRDWKRSGHGAANLHLAIVQSCDIYFYDLGNRLGIETLSDYAFRFGMGKPSGIELASEKGGLIPTPQWKLRAKGTEWYPGETLHASIGQGFVSATPFQLANLIGAVAVSGDRFQPHILKAIRKKTTGQLIEFPPVRIGAVDVSIETFQLIQKGLIGVVSENKGTGGRARSRKVTIGGKTGTAQVVSSKSGVKQKDLPKNLRDHAWFIAYAPIENPRIAIVVLVENGGHGGSAAAPLARIIIEEHMKNVSSETHQQL